LNDGAHHYIIGGGNENRPWVRAASSAQSRMEGQSEARIALGDGRARSQAIITRRERGDFGVYDFDQYVFPQDCALEATRTQGGRSLHVALRRPERMKIAARG